MCCCVLLLELEIQACRAVADGGASAALPDQLDIAADQGGDLSFELGFRWLLRHWIGPVAAFHRRASKGLR
jgi:hypothetical protein